LSLLSSDFYGLLFGMIQPRFQILTRALICATGLFLFVRWGACTVLQLFLTRSLKALPTILALLPFIRRCHCGTYCLLLALHAYVLWDVFFLHSF
jgi:hypothetical protein